MNMSPFLAGRRPTRRRQAQSSRSRPPIHPHDEWSLVAEEQRRSANYPISRWCWRPLAGWLAGRLADLGAAPLALTLANMAFGLIACAVLVAYPAALAPAAALFLIAWICDRTDGQLARRLQTTSRSGAWLDANVDELIDVAGKAAAAYACCRLLNSETPWLAFALFAAGKYLTMHSLLTADLSEAAARAAVPLRDAIRQTPAEPLVETEISRWKSLAAVRRWPANADVRLHVFLVALLAAIWQPWALVIETAFFGGYYLLWSLARLAIVPARAASPAHG